MKPILAAALVSATLAIALPGAVMAKPVPAGDSAGMLPTTSVATPQDLIALLEGRGYVVDIVTRDGDGNLLFRVAPPGTGETFMLLVDAHDGSILIRPPQGAGHRHRRPWPGSPYEAIRNDPAIA